MYKKQKIAYIDREPIELFTKYWKILQFFVIYWNVIYININIKTLVTILNIKIIEEKKTSKNKLEINNVKLSNKIKKEKNQILKPKIKKILKVY